MMNRQRRPEDNRHISEVVANLGVLLEHKESIAYVVGMPSEESVQTWLDADSVPDDSLMEKKLRVAEKLATVVRDESRPWVSRSWLIGCNPWLSEYSPAEMIGLLRGEPTDADTIRSLSDAAEAFAQIR